MTDPFRHLGCRVFQQGPGDACSHQNAYDQGQGNDGLYFVHR